MDGTLKILILNFLVQVFYLLIKLPQLDQNSFQKIFLFTHWLYPSESSDGAEKKYTSSIHSIELGNP